MKDHVLKALPNQYLDSQELLKIFLYLLAKITVHFKMFVIFNIESNGHCLMISTIALLDFYSILYQRTVHVI